MSQDDSTAPAPETVADPGQSAKRSVNLSVLIGAGLALLLGVVAFLVIGPGDEDAAAGPDCVTNNLRLTTAPVLKDLVDEAVKAVENDEDCITFTVAEGTVKDVLAILNDPDAEMPDLWIPDSPTWKGQLTSAGWTGTPIADVIAQTPVGLVSGPAAEAPASWRAVLEGGRLAMADPSADGAAALALLAPYAEASNAKAAAAGILAATVPVAQAFGERAVDGGGTVNDMSAITDTSTQLIPATEQAYLSARRTNNQIRMVAPRTGVPMLQFPIIDVERATTDEADSTESADVSGRAGRALAHWFASSLGQQAITAAEFRTADGAELQGGVGLGAAKGLRKVDQKTTDEALRNWRVVSVPSSILAVMDLSGSMKRAIGDVSRIQLTASAANIAIGALSTQARIGIWGFSKNRGEAGQSWEEYVPLRPLDADAGEAGAHGDLVRAEAAKLPSRVRGATGLMDTTLAAYKAAQEEWDPAYFNSVVIFTDGASDDTSSLSIDGLVKQLTSLRDPSKPVKVIVIGISQDANTPELAQIANATGGQNYLVTNPDDILGVLASALLNR